MQQRYSLPDSNRLSVLTAVILLAYALTRLIDIPPYTLQINLLGLDLAFNISAGAAISFFAAGLTASGMDWLLRGHPLFGQKETGEHWILPSLTGWVLGVYLYSLSENPLWWAGILLGGVFLVLICIAEYVAVDPSDARYGFATAALTGLSFILLLLLVSALHAVGIRLVLFIPILFISVWLVSLRALHLRLGGKWEYYWSSGIALVVAQIAAALHYWPITDIQFALAILGPAYSLTSFAATWSEDHSVRRAIIEPIVILAVIWGIAAFQ